jgi:UDP-glucose 4-epimerase
MVLELAARKGRRVLVASSSEVYGKSDKRFFSEDQDLLIGSPRYSRWSYACSKLLDEFLALAYGQAKQVPVIIVRLFNTVGPRQTGAYGMVIPRFVRQALRGQPLTVFGSGEQTRCFGYVKDVVGALSQLMESDEAVGDIFNVGHDEPVTINELAQRVKQLTDSPSEIVHIPYDEAYAPGFEDILHRAPNLEKLRRVLRYEHRTSLEEILQGVIEYERREMGYD